MINLLGISCFYHDSAAAIVQDGEIIAAAQEERFTRIKHDSTFPRNSINYCLEEAFLEPNELNAIIFYDNPIYSFDRLIKTFINSEKSIEDQWCKAIPRFLSSKFSIQSLIQDMLNIQIPVYVTRHHLSHAASAFFPSPFESAAILTVDGVGEWATTSISFGQDREVETLKEINFPHSLGLLYSAFTYYCGFKVNSGEYKLMGLAPYGNPVYVDMIYEHLVAIKSDGSFRLNMDFFGYLDSDYMTNQKFHQLFGGLPRKPETMITKKEMDLASSIQKVTEDIIKGLAKHAKELTGSDSLCLAGGVALNCVSNGILDNSKLFKNLWIQPAAGDAGGALGAALAASHMLFKIPRKLNINKDSQKGSLLGPSYSTYEVRAALDQYGAIYDVVDDAKERAFRIANAIKDGKIVGFMNGRMEFGPRALGSRSILGDPRREDTQAKMNLKIKYRESFRPFAPSILKSRANEWFDLNNDSPYMLLVTTISKDKRKSFNKKELSNNNLLNIVNIPKSTIPAVTHVDYSARIQTITIENNSEYFNLISAFESLTGCPVLVNTSFNVRGEPIVCSPDDAYKCFMRTEMDLLVVENCIMQKSHQPHNQPDDSWKDQYELD